MATPGEEFVHEVEEDLDGPDAVPHAEGPATQSVGDCAKTKTHLPPFIGRYHVLASLGSGGQGTVYLAEDPTLHRQVAIKVPHLKLDRDPHGVARFYKEARAAAQLQHPNICPVYDVDTFQETPYLVAAYVKGSPLSQRIADYGEPRKAAELVLKIAYALAEMHRHQMVHRDIKPANIIIQEDGEPVLTDFGLAIRADELLVAGHEAQASASQGASPKVGPAQGEPLAQEEPLSESVELSHAPAHQTGTSQLLPFAGTLPYASPEQVCGDVAAIGTACDIYGLGATFYEILTGRKVFVAEDRAQLYDMIVSRPPRTPHEERPDIPQRLEIICLQCLAKEPGDRPTAQRLASDLELYLHGPPKGSRALATPKRFVPSESLVATALRGSGTFRELFGDRVKGVFANLAYEAAARGESRFAVSAGDRLTAPVVQRLLESLPIDPLRAESLFLQLVGELREAARSLHFGGDWGRLMEQAGGLALETVPFERVPADRPRARVIGGTAKKPR